jgi:hypothetical protein
MKMAVVHYVTRETMLPGGEKLIRGKLTVGSTAAAGAALNLANYFKSSTECTVVCEAFVQNAVTNAAFGVATNQANAETITVQTFVGGLGASQPFYVSNAGLELTARNIGFHAIGQAY